MRSWNKKSNYFFEEEHNSSWYYFDIIRDGELVLEITPLKTDDDYDFILFKYTDSSFCKQVAQQRIIPVRSNLSRTGKDSINNRTGLSAGFSNERIGSGKGQGYSRPLDVKKGERYYLVLDNVYPDGKGHTVTLGYLTDVHLSGTIKDDSSKMIKAEITIENEKGDQVYRTFSNDSGRYDINLKLWGESKYNLVMVEDSCWVESKALQTKLKNRNDFTDIKTILPRLRAGKKYVLGNINFYGGSSILLPESISSVNSLYNLMKRNKKMIIRLEGHVNSPGSASENFNKPLSEARANEVKNRLLKSGIAEERMSIIGFGSKYMLYPNAKNELEQSSNRRVEVNIISLK